MIRSLRVGLERLGLVAGGLLCGVLIAEVALRVLGIGYPVFSRPDATRGWSLAPHATGEYTAEGGAPVRINGDGMRDRDHAREKPPGTYRIAVLGDSFVEALEVPEDRAFWSVLESELGRRGGVGGKQVEVLAFGVRGYATAQELLTLECCVWKYAPDLVLLAVMTANDLSDNSRALDRGSTRAYRPYFVPDGEGLALDDSFRHSLRFRLGRIVAPVVRRSRILQLALRAHHRFMARKGHEQDPGPAGTGYEVALDSEIYRPPASEAWKQAWLVTERLLARMSRETSAHGARFAVVTLTNGIQVHPDRALRARFMENLGVKDLFYADDRIRALGEREGFAVLNLARPLQAQVDATGVWLHGFRNRSLGVGHWNAEGHRVAGERIATWILSWPS